MRGSVNSPPQLGQTLRLDLVGAETHLAFLAVDQRIGEPLDMARCHPDLRRHQDSGVETLDIVAAVGHRLPPEAFDIVLELDAQRAVIPAGAQAAVDFG